MFENFDRTTSIIATTAEWTANDIVLKNGEFGVEVLPSTDVKIKSGDGVKTFSALSYVNVSDVTINTATQAALDAKLPLVGGTMTGLLVLSGDPATALGAATKQYVDAINSSITTSLADKISSAGGTMTGFLNLSSAPTSNLHAATKLYVDTANALAVKKSGDTMSGALVLAADPANAMEAATKQYVDAGAYQTIVGGSATYSGKVVKLNSFGFLDTSVVPILSTYVGTINLTTSYALTGTYTVGSYFAAITTGTIDASWNTKINGAPSTCGAGQFLIFSLTGKWDLVGDSTSSTSIAAKLDKSGGTMTGFITLSADPTSALHAATKQYADLKLPLAGGTLTGALTLAADPTSSLHAATKQYVDTSNALAALKANNLSDIASATTALTNLGGTTTGKSLFTTGSATAARTTLGSTTVGDALFTTASAAAGRTTLAAAASGSNTDITSVSLSNTGLRIADTDASHTLSVAPSSNLTANRTFSIATGDADRTLDISSGALAVTGGGTNQTSYTIGDLLYASGTTSLAKLADIATGNALISGGVGVAPAWGKVGLTTHISGTLAVANGGTGVTTLTGIVKGNGTSAMTAAVAGTDYVIPSGLSGYAPLASPVLTGTISVVGQATLPLQTLTDGASVSWDVSLGSKAKVTLGGNRAIAAVSNAVEGTSYTLWIVQDATGTRSVTWASTGAGSYDFSAEGAPALTTTPSRADLLGFEAISIAGTLKLRFVGIKRGFA